MDGEETKDVQECDRQLGGHFVEEHAKPVLPSARVPALDGIRQG